MAHTPMDDIQDLWTQAPHNWSGLHQNLQQRKGEAEGISDTLVDKMLQISQKERQEKHPFPNSPQELYNLLNQQLPG